MKIMWVLPAFLMIGVPQDVLAFFTKGNELYEWGLEAEAAEAGSTIADYNKAERFISYVTGVVDGVGLLTKAGMSTVRVCVPKDATIGQISSIVMKYLRAHPEERHQAGSTLILAALLEVYVCPKEADSRRNSERLGPGFTVARCSHGRQVARRQRAFIHRQAMAKHVQCAG